MIPALSSLLMPNVAALFLSAMNTPADLVRQYFAAYENEDRGALEGLLTDDFTFTSPLDDGISRTVYFERCWPNSATHRSFNILKLVEQGNEVFVTYECRRDDGAVFRNTEFFVCHGERILKVEVYFGRETGQRTVQDEAEITALFTGLAAACRTKDVEEVMAAYAREVLTFDLMAPLLYAGAETTTVRLKEWFDSFEGDALEYELVNLTVRPGGDTAYAHTLHHATGTKKDGERADVWWRGTYGLKKFNGRWEITHEHTSMPLNPVTAKAEGA